jgi:hypothetical protein
MGMIVRSIIHGRSFRRVGLVEVGWRGSVSDRVSLGSSVVEGELGERGRMLT